MGHEPDRNDWLGKHCGSSSAAAPDACLDAETLAAWADGALNAQAATAVEAHVSSCRAVHGCSRGDGTHGSGGPSSPRLDAGAPVPLAGADDRCRHGGCHLGDRPGSSRHGACCCRLRKKSQARQRPCGCRYLRTNPSFRRRLQNWEPGSRRLHPHPERRTAGGSRTPASRRVSCSPHEPGDGAAGRCGAVRASRTATGAELRRRHRRAASDSRPGQRRRSGADNDSR